MHPVGGRLAATSPLPISQVKKPAFTLVAFGRKTIVGQSPNGSPRSASAPAVPTFPPPRAASMAPSSPAAPATSAPGMTPTAPGMALPSPAVAEILGERAAGSSLLMASRLVDTSPFIGPELPSDARRGAVLSRCDPNKHGEHSPLGGRACDAGRCRRSVACGPVAIAQLPLPALHHPRSAPPRS